MAELSMHHISRRFHSTNVQVGFPILFSEKFIYLRRKQLQFSANHHQYGFYSVNRHGCSVRFFHFFSSTWLLSHLMLIQHARKIPLEKKIIKENHSTPPTPGRMGFLGAAERLLKVLAMVWAGSQVTKLVRAGGALALAPFVDRGLSWFTRKFKFESKGKAFMGITAFCFGLALVIFLVLTLLWS